MPLMLMLTFYFLCRESNHLRPYYIITRTEMYQHTAIHFVNRHELLLLAMSRSTLRC